MADLWEVSNNFKITLAERVRLDTGDLRLPVSSTVTSIRLLAGKLPSGLRIVGTEILGTPFEQATTVEYKVVLRATADTGIQDRTLIFYVGEEDQPFWVTNPDLLPVGRGDSFFILDNEFIEFQLIAQDPDVSAGQPLEYYIRSGDGELPPGIRLTSDGKLVGVVEPLLALDKRAESGGWDTSPYDIFPIDFAIRSDNGWDSFFYDTVNFDFSYAAQTPKKLNRYYQFRVTVNDGYSTEPPQRVFRIFVVGDDYLRADNSIMKVSNGVFKADNTNIRQPIWITPSNLGYKRANNNITVYLDVYNSDTLDGKVIYSLEENNDDGTPSILPPGTKIDTLNGEITGTLPYQPAVTKEYKFTVRATRYTLDVDYALVTATVYEDTLAGSRSFKVYKLPLTVQDGVTLNDGIDDLAILRGESLVLNGKTYYVEAVDGTNEDYDIITLVTPIEAKVEFTVAEPSISESNYLIVEKVNYIVQQSMLGKTLRIASEQYTIKDFYNYVEWEISSATGSIGINLTAAETSAAPIGVSESRVDLLNRIFNKGRPEDIPVFVLAADVGLIRIIVPNDSLSSSARIKQIFYYIGSGIDNLVYTKIRDNIDIIKFTTNFELGRQFIKGQTIGLGLFADDVFEKSIISLANSDVNNPSTAKTFSLSVLGEVDSVIAWLSPANLGSITANFISTLRVVAATTVPDARLVYTLISGSLPNGLTLAYNGEIIGKVRQFGTLDSPGLTTIDGANFSLDNSTTTIDRSKTFKIKAADRFGFSAIEREFTVYINDEDDTLYSNLYMRPMLEPVIRDQYRRFISDPIIFPPSSIYRAADSNFGIQPTINILAYAGIETKRIDEFVAAVAKNHKRKTFRTGEVKRAIARDPGSTDTVYEVIYLELVDPQEPKQGKTAKYIVAQPDPPITVDTVALEVQDDVTAQDTGVALIPVDGRYRGQEVIIDGIDSFVIRNREGIPLVQVFDNNDVDVLLRDGITEINIDIIASDAEPLRQRFRDKIINNIKADSNAVILNYANELRYYISNITNMREQLEEVGKSQSKFLPLWMRTGQENAIQELGYIPAIPLAYCKAGQGEQVRLNVLNALQNGEFDFKNLNIDIDRYVLDSAENINEERYIVFQNYIFNV